MVFYELQNLQSKKASYRVPVTRPLLQMVDYFVFPGDRKPETGDLQLVLLMPLLKQM
jgi:hypothetical protein